MSKPRVRYYFYRKGVTNNAALSTKDSTGSANIDISQATSGNQPTLKSRNNASSTLDAGVSSILCDGSDFMSLASTETIPSTTPYTIVCMWTGADYTNDTYLISSSSNDAHYGIEAGGTGVIAKPNGSKGAAAARVFATNDTTNSTVSYTFGSDVETLVIVNHGDLSLDFYNIDGRKIASVSSSAGMTASFPIDHILGKSDGTKGFNGEFLELAVYVNVEFSGGHAEAYGNIAKSLRDA